MRPPTQFSRYRCAMTLALLFAMSSFAFAVLFSAWAIASREHLRRRVNGLAEERNKLVCIENKLRADLAAYETRQPSIDGLLKENERHERFCSRYKSQRDAAYECISEIVAALRKHDGQPGDSDV